MESGLPFRRRKLDDNKVDEELRAAIKSFCLGLNAALNKCALFAFVRFVLWVFRALHFEWVMQMCDRCCGS